MKIFNKLVSLLACVCLLSGFSEFIQDTYTNISADTNGCIVICDNSVDNPIVKA